MPLPVPLRASLTALLCLGLLGGLPACGPAFRSVRQTAALGDRVGADAGALLGGPRICELLLGGTARAAAQAGVPQPGCAEVGVQETAQVMRRGAGLLQAYARALGDLAQDGRFSLGSIFDLIGNGKATAEAQLGGSLSVGSAGQKLSALMALASSNWRQKELARLVGAAQPHVSAIGEGLRLHVRLQQEALRSLRGDAKGGERGLLGTLGRELQDMDRFLKCGERDLTCRSLLRYGPLWAMELAQLTAWADDQAQGLDRFDQSLAAFLLAHGILARHAADARSGLRPDDAIYAEIRQELERVLGPELKDPKDPRQAPPAPQTGGPRARSGERD